jgi:hypothetical protein
MEVSLFEQTLVQASVFYWAVKKLSRRLQGGIYLSFA